MKAPAIFLISGAVIMLILTSSFYMSHAQSPGEKSIQDTIVIYKDGVYDGQSRDGYIDEPYWGKVRITIKDGMFAGIKFMIRDSNLHETFTKKYKKHYKGNPEYIQQVRKDSKGVQIYPKILLKTQDISKTDAVSGATWSYNIFRASAEEALKKAEK